MRCKMNPPTWRDIAKQFVCKIINLQDKLKIKSQPENRPAPINPITMKTFTKIACPLVTTKTIFGNSENKKASLRTGQPL